MPWRRRNNSWMTTSPKLFASRKDSRLTDASRRNRQTKLSRAIASPGAGEANSRFASMCRRSIFATCASRSLRRLSFASTLSIISEPHAFWIPQRQPLAFRLLHGQFEAVNIVHVAHVVAIVELAKILVQVVLANVVIDPVDPRP